MTILGGDVMAMRTSKKTVSFRRPFTLKSLDEVLPAGTYTVETDEEPITGISFLAYRRIQTLLYVHGKPGQTVPSRLLTIDPNELDAALKRDQLCAHNSILQSPENKSEKPIPISQRQQAESQGRSDQGRQVAG